jgi:hypothetical protein
MINAPSSIKNADQARVPDMHPDQEGQSVVLRTKSMVRSKVEHAFHIIKRLFGLFRFCVRLVCPCCNGAMHPTALINKGRSGIGLDYFSPPAWSSERSFLQRPTPLPSPPHDIHLIPGGPSEYRAKHPPDFHRHPQRGSRLHGRLVGIGIRNAEAVYTDDWLAHGLSVIVSNDHILTVKYAAGGVEGEK